MKKRGTKKIYSRGCGFGNAKLRINRYAKEMFVVVGC